MRKCTDVGSTDGEGGKVLFSELLSLTFLGTFLPRTEWLN